MRKKLAHCQARNCPSNHLTRPSRIFFSFPLRDEVRCRIWAERCGNESLIGLPLTKMKYLRLCGDHFDRNAFMNDLRKSLVHDAVPTIFHHVKDKSPVKKCTDFRENQVLRHECKVMNCQTNRLTSPNVMFFSFPISDEQRCRLWTERCGNKSLFGLPLTIMKTYELCGNHFEMNAFTNDMKNSLVHDAVPTIFGDGSTYNKPIIPQPVSKASKSATKNTGANIPSALESEDLSKEAAISCVKRFELIQRVYPVHKDIVAAKSPVLAALFEDAVVADGDKSQLIDTELNDNVLREMLTYIYTGIPGPVRNMVDLLQAAYKYGMKDLFALCEDKIYITADTAADLLIVADKHGAKKLKARAVTCINSNYGAVVQTAGWKRMINSHPRLLEMVYLQAMADRDKTASMQETKQQSDDQIEIVTKCQ